MKKTVVAAIVCAVITAGQAFAADMPVKGPRMAPPPPPPAESSWSGWYWGANVGAAFSGRDRNRVDETRDGAPFVSGTWPGFGEFGTLDLSGGFGGGQVGYNWQAGTWVYGLEADLQGSGISDSKNVTLPYIDAADTITVATRSRVEWFGTLRGRIGTIWNNTLLYATGGLAYGGARYHVHMDDTFAFVADHSWKPNRVGYAIGAGWEFRLAPRWTGKLEYLYVDLGTFNVNAVEFRNGAPTAFAIASEAWPNFHTVKFGINYHYDSMPGR